MKRFSRSNLLTDLDTLAASLQQANAFDRGTGTSQLCPPQSSAKIKSTVDRAVEYGRLQAIEDIHRMIHDGEIGVR